jgi:hypothetical protein
VEFVIDVPDGLELQGRMGHVEMTGQAALQVIEDTADFTLTDAVSIGSDEVSVQA